MDLPDFAAPQAVSLPLAGLNGQRMVEITPLTVGQICRLLKAAAHSVHLLLGLPSDLVQRLTSEEGPSMADQLKLFEVLSEDPDRFVELVAIAARLPDADVAALPPDQFAFLFAVVLQVNADFFSRAAPAFRAAGRVLQQLKPQAGAPSATPGLEPSTS